MFYHIEGTVTDLEANLAVIDCSGVGYKINTTTTTLSRLKIGEGLSFIHTVTLEKTLLTCTAFTA